MKRSAFLLLLSVTFTVSAEDKFDVQWQIKEGLKSPESAYYDATSGFLFLSQIGEGGGGGKDGDGWISKLTLDGKVVKDKWVTGLNAPKGLRSHGNSLLVSDIDRVVEVDIKAGKIKRVVAIPGAKFLNDLATGPDGAVYVSDMVSSRIIKVVDGKPSVFVEGPEIQHPNGLLVDGDSLIVGGWGKGFKADFSTEVLGQLLRVNLKTKKIEAITSKPTGHLDGIEADGKGGYLVTDWINGKLFHINKAGAARVIKKYPKGLADHAYLADRGLLIIPEMIDGKLTAYKLKLK